MKNILTSGGHIEYPYKEKKKEWVGTAKITSFAGGWGLSPKITVYISTIEVPGGMKQFEVSEIDDAVALFKRLVLCKKNLMYKRHEAILSLLEKDLDVDFDFEEKKTLIK